jgi:hypothetical protein
MQAPLEQLLGGGLLHVQLKLTDPFPLEQYPVVIPAGQQFTVQPERAEINFPDGPGMVDNLQSHSHPIPIVHFDIVMYKQLAIRAR